MTNPPTTTDFLSQAALRKPPPLTDPNFLRKWAGLSMFDNEAAVRRIGRIRRWRIGAHLATLRIPDDAPIIYTGPEQEGSGHWLLFDANGDQLTDDGARFLLGCVVQIVHGPATEPRASGTVPGRMLE